MPEKIILKLKAANQVAPNLPNYDSYYSIFKWKKTLTQLDGLPKNSGLNIVYEAVDKHVVHGNGSKQLCDSLGK